MPLYIDLHIDNNLTPELVKQCHVADKALQEKYGVRYLQILLNQPQGYLFCLVEGPDKETCARVHREAHGNIACNILEITESDFGALLSGKKKNEFDFTLNADGSLDSGIRAVISVSILGSREAQRQTKELIREILRNNEGRSGESFGNQVVAIFDSALLSLQAAGHVAERVHHRSDVEVRMGISLGFPIEAKGNLFEDAQRSAGHLAFFSHDGQVTISSRVIELAGEIPASVSTRIAVIDAQSEKFLLRVMEGVSRMWEKNDSTINEFAHDLGLSKSQLTRKLAVITDLSPNQLINEYRMRQAVSMMMNNSLNVAEVTMAIGFSNPSYFTKCFRKRFGKAPSDYLTAPSNV